MSDRDASARSVQADSSLWRNQDFVRFLLGRLVTNAGDSLYSVAILWLVFQLTGSTVFTGIANSLLLLPFLLQVIAGPIVDRFPLKRLLVWAQFVQGVVILVLPTAAYTGHLSVWLILATIPVLSLVNLVISPAQTALIPRILPDQQLSQANSALGTVSLGLDMLFEAIGGALIALFGAVALFVLDSVTFLVAGVLFAGLAIPTLERDHEGDSEPDETAISTYLNDLRTGVDVLRGTLFVEMLFAAAVSNFAVGVTLTTLPAYGDLLGGATIYGLLLGALGIGRVIGTVSGSYLETVPYGWLVIVIYLAATFIWLTSVALPSITLTVGLFGLAWVAGGIDTVLIETLNQRVFPHHLLGRISSIKGTVSTATLPLGSLIGGVIAAQLGTVATMVVAGFGFGFLGLYFLFRTPLRRLPPVREMTPSTFNLQSESESKPDTGDTEG